MEMESGSPAPPTAPTHRTSLQCRNCGTPAPGAYCPRCGQNTSEHLPNAFEFAHEFILHYFAADGRLWRTLWALVSKPGLLTIEYLKGRKFAYVLPLRLYLTLSVAFFLALKLSFSLTPAAKLEPTLRKNLASGDVYMGFVVGHAVRHADGTVTCTLPRLLCEPIKKRLSGPPEEVAHRIASLPLNFMSSLSSAMFALLPLFALWLKLAFYNRNYGEHFLFALHLHGFWFLTFLLLLLPLTQYVGALVVLYLVIFSFIALQRVYGGRRWLMLLKGVIVTIVYCISLCAMSFALAVRAFVT